MLDEHLSPEATASLRTSLNRRSAQLPNLPKVPAPKVPAPKVLAKTTTPRLKPYPAASGLEIDAEMEIDMGPRTPLRRSWMTKVPIVASLHRYFTTPRAHKPSGTRPAGSRVLRRLAQQPIVPRPQPIAFMPLEVASASPLASIEPMSPQPIDGPIDAPQADRTSKSFAPPKAEKPGGTRPAGGR
jgi:hypothetical protein